MLWSGLYAGLKATEIMNRIIPKTVTKCFLHYKNYTEVAATFIFSIEQLTVPR